MTRPHKLVAQRWIPKTQIHAVAKNDQQHEVVEYIVVDSQPNACFPQRMLDVKEKQRLAVADERCELVRVVFNLQCEHKTR